MKIFHDDDDDDDDSSRWSIATTCKSRNNSNCRMINFCAEGLSQHALSAASFSCVAAVLVELHSRSANRGRPIHSMSTASQTSSTNFLRSYYVLS